MTRAKRANDNTERVLILAPLGRDGPVMAERLREGGFAAEVCADAHAVARQFAAGAGALVLSEESLEQAGIPDLFARLHAQPPWSEVPLIVLTIGGESRLPRLLDVAARAAGAIMLLERPLGAATLLRAIEASLRSRRRQYQVRGLLEQKRRHNAALQAAHTAALNLADDAARARDQAEQASAALRELNRELDRRVEQRTAQLRMLASRLANAQEAERRRIAAGLHDEACQLLAAAQLKLVQAQDCEEKDDRNHLLDETDRLLTEAADEMRGLTFELSSTALFESGFVPAAGELCTHMSKRHGIRFEFECARDDVAVPVWLRPTLYHCLRELLYNVVKHAGVDEARVRIEESVPVNGREPPPEKNGGGPPSPQKPWSRPSPAGSAGADNRLIRITVRDYGKGFDVRDLDRPLTREGGFGLRHLRERMSDIGGKLRIESVPGDGTRAVLEVVMGRSLGTTPSPSMNPMTAAQRPHDASAASKRRSR